MAERFWLKVDIRSLDDCWNWLSCKDPNGYGRFKSNFGTGLAHRIAWILTNGSIPDGLFLCHKCDNSSCVNPRHLFLGTQEDNIDDMYSKNRGAVGSRHGNSKLSELDVEEIINSTDSQQTIAKKYGVKQQAVSKIKLGLRWKRALCQT